MIQVPAGGRGSTNKSAQVGHRRPQWVVMYGVADDVGRVDHYTRFKSSRYAVTAVQYWGQLGGVHALMLLYLDWLVRL